MPPSFPATAQSAFLVGRSPWTAADALVGLLGLEKADFTAEKRVQGDPRRPGGLPHKSPVRHGDWNSGRRRQSA